MIHNRKLTTKKLSELDPYTIIKSNIEYTDVKRSTYDEQTISGEDSYGSEKEDKRLTNTWLKESPLASVIIAQVHRNGSASDSANAYILSLLYVAGGITSVALGGGSALKNEEEKAILLCLMLISFFYLNGLCLGTFTSVQVEEYRRQTQFINKFKLILSNLGSHNISKSLRSKMLKYYIQFWRQQDAINYSALFVSLPMAIRQQVLLDKFWYAIDEQLQVKIIRKLATSCQSVSLPPNEYVCYAGEVSREMYIIEHGYCEVISASSEKVDKILGPMSGFCMIETLLELAGIFNVRTITHVTLLKLALTSIKEAMLLVPEASEQLTALSAETKNSFAVRRLFTISSSEISHVSTEEKNDSWVVFPSSIVDPRYIDFHNGWTKFALIKYLMLRRTIQPYGEFILIWEIVRAIFAYASAMIFPVLHIYQCYVPNLNYYVLILDGFGLIDIKAIDHFEYIWQRTHGMDASNILRQCHVALRKDCALYLYEDTLKHVTVFADMLPSFYRMLGTAVNENYYLKNYPIIQLNDIVKYVYIIHKGEVLVIGPDGSYFATLTRGCMFGNLDDIKHTRSMVTILSSTNVDLLTVPTEIFYYRLRDYPVVRNRIQKHILLENLSYMQTKVGKSEEQSGNTVGYNFLNINVLAIKVASILITMTTILHTETCIWYMIGKDNKDGWMYGTNRTTTCVNNYLCSLYFSVSLTSFSGYMNTRPRTVIELVILIFNTIVNKFIAAVVIGDMSSITKSSSSTLMNFDYSRGKMELFLKHSYISMPLFKGVMLYTSHLWHKSQGYQIPIFITQAPGYISASIKWAAYGHHIRDNWVFMDTHTDFIRLLIKKLQLHVYFPEDTICQQGDVNSTMYFIHSGNVNAYYITDTEEIHVDSLDQNDCFGMVHITF
ncbi:cyclic nucleotide-gated cation channel subunit a [Holotrichia oblita]|uniref:Cyclic nucleotide-gated cation channel subunit a n=1 Tax=Holotrichia oblita TaxID=644536 RepID=A0ACB9T4U1_HOLOL|nr:cyclic nucleotide-gated cation channel subunit a [Holotrichia oblita]